MTDLFPPVQPVDALPLFESLAPNGRYRFALSVGLMADGSEVRLPVNVLHGQAAHPRLLMIAGVHGDEYDGITAQAALWSNLDPETLAGTIVFVPVANPPAFRAGTRRNPEDEVDMNRIFPGDPTRSITYRLAHRLYHDVLPDTDLLLSMHGWSAGGDITPYVEYPKAAAVTETSRAAAVAFGLPYIEAFDWLPGLFVAAAVRSGIAAIEPEIGGMRLSRADCHMRYYEGTQHLLRHLGMLNDGKGFEAVAPCEVTRTEITAATGGIFLKQVALHQQVHKGETLALITDLNHTPLEQIEAPADGLIASVRMQGMVNPGDTVVVLFHPQR